MQSNSVLQYTLEGRFMYIMQCCSVEKLVDSVKFLPVCSSQFVMLDAKKENEEILINPDDKYSLPRREIHSYQKKNSDAQQ